MRQGLLYGRGGVRAIGEPTLTSSMPAFSAPPHLESLPSPSPRAKIQCFNPPPPNFDE